MNDYFNKLQQWGWSEWGTILSAIGALFSAISLLGIQQIRRKVVARQRLPEILKDFCKKLATLNSQTNTARAYDSGRAAFVTEVQQIRVLLTSWSDKTTDTRFKKEIRSLSKCCKKLGTAASHDEAINIIIRLRTCEMMMKLEIKDLSQPF